MKFLSIILVAVFALPCLAQSTFNEEVRRIHDMNEESTHLEAFNQPQTQLMSVDRFDIETFDHNRRMTEWNFIRPDGVHVRQIANKEKGYVEELSRPDSPYKYAGLYDRQGYLTRKVARFYSQYVGDAFDFDRAGKVVNKRNMDGPFLYTINELKEQMKRDFNVDIMNTSTVWLVRRAIRGEAEKPFYEIYAFKMVGSTWMDAYLVDGVSGKFLYKTNVLGTPDGLEPDLYEEYLKAIDGAMQ